jgi:Zn-dependent M16 (insulinase) family peptidase
VSITKGNDFTRYLFSAGHVSEFERFLSSLLAMVFYPKLEDHFFLQEGWRLELSERASSTQSRFSGIVFNEMKVILFFFLCLEQLNTSSHLHILT